MRRVGDILAEAQAGAALALRLGARLLETTGQGIIEVAAAVGYESEAAFNRAFRRELGVPPGGYRRQHTRAATSST